MKEGVFEETVEVLEDYVPCESYVLPEPTLTVRKKQSVKVK